MNLHMLLDTENNINSEIRIRAYEIFANKSYPLHWHNYLELELVVSGSGTHIVDGKRSELKRGCAYLMTYTDFHAIEDAEDLRIINISYDEEILPQSLSQFFYTSNSGFSCFIRESEFEGMVRNSRRLIDELNNSMPFKKEFCSSVLTDILISFLRNCNTQEIKEKPPTVQEAIRLIHSDYKTELSLSSIAERLSLSPNYFGNLFKKNIGISITEYIKTIRLCFAARKLISTDYSIKKIAEISGFDSVSYFIYCFRERYGISPNAYRKTYAEQKENGLIINEEKDIYIHAEKV